MNVTFKHISTVIAAIAAVTVMSCSKENEVIMPDHSHDGDEPGTEEPQKPTTDSYNEQYRPQVHYTPIRNWMNDPNGMVYANGTWHLFYQYNPQGNGWGNMSWGHATSTDLMHWEEQEVALVRDNLGDIFSGSAVIDKDNTAGFGRDAMIALYTSAGQRQQQSMAYSTDGGKTFTRFGGNPIIGNTDKDDFRDPKVFWHEESHQWIMSLARGWTKAIDFYASKDLKSWSLLSSFSMPDVAKCNGGQWECPDLIKIGNKWVLIVSTNPGGPVSGSGTMYFIGNFDGTTFTADTHDYPLWLDFGLDNYAGVTYSNAPGGRWVFIGWMNNWNYSGDVPCSPWRSAMTLPRELTLTQIDGKNYVGSAVVKELDGIAGSWSDISGTLPEASAYHVQVAVDMTESHTLSLSNAKGEHYDLEVRPGNHSLVVRRNSNTGTTTFHNLFSLPAITAPVYGTASTVTLDIYIDQSSVEVLTADGTTSITNLVFPSSIYNKVEIDGKPVGKVRALNRVWK